MKTYKKRAVAKGELAAALAAIPASDEPGVWSAVATVRDLLVENGMTSRDSLDAYTSTLMEVLARSNASAADGMCLAAWVMHSVAMSVATKLEVRPEKVVVAIHAFAERMVHPSDCPHCLAMERDEAGAMGEVH